MKTKAQWQLIVPKGHGAFKGVCVIHKFDTREEALSFLADFVSGPAIKAGEMPPEADLRAVVKHDFCETESQLTRDLRTLAGAGFFESNDNEPGVIELLKARVLAALQGEEAES